MNKTIVVFAANKCSMEKESVYYPLAYELGKQLAQAGFIVANGAGSGLMEQTLKGAFDVGGETIGIGLDIENRKQCQYAKTITTFKDLKERQKELINLADGFVALPGGMGTAYEILEIIALKRVSQIEPEMPFIILGDYYKSLINAFENMYLEGFAEKSVFDCFSFARTPEEAIKTLASAL